MDAAGRLAWASLERRVRLEASEGRFDERVAQRLPSAARHHLERSIAAGTSLAPAARLEMRGRIKVGRWLPFRARQLLAPRHGTVWMATVGGVIRGSDHYVAGAGGMTWKLFGLVPMVRAEGDDVTRSAAGRAAGESIWVPTALVAEADWRERARGEVDVTFSVDDHQVTLTHVLGEDGRLLRSRFMRWGDPDRTGTWSQHPFGVEVTGHRTFDGVTIPHAGRAGWHVDTERWEDGVFFEFEITAYELQGNR